MNILFYKHTTINPLKGGIDRVTDVLYKKFKEEHNVYVLMLEKVAENTDSHFYYVPNPQNEFSDDNFKFAEELINDLKIDIIINQEGITPSSSKFISDATPFCKIPFAEYVSIASEPPYS